MKAWFNGALAFSCTACGKCCRGKTNVFVNTFEIQSIADRLQLSTDEFQSKFTETRADGTVSLISNPLKTACVFLKGSKCSIYEDRPTKCRTYPYWPEVVVGKAEWLGEASTCEGIAMASSTRPAIATDHIVENLVIGELHDRGRGESWTLFEESLETLRDAVAAQPDMLEEFEADFASQFTSDIGNCFLQYMILE